MNMKVTIGILMLFLSVGAGGQSFTETIVKEASFEKISPGNTVLIANINGEVNVVGYEGNKIMVEVIKTIKAKTNERLEKGKKEIQLGLIDRADTLLFYVAGACNSFGKKTKGDNNRSGRSDWGYHWDDCRGGNCDLPYDYVMNFTVKVPFGTNLLLSTVNNGDVKVENVKGVVHAGNVNGSIKLTHLQRGSEASTVNGNVDISFDRNPNEGCRFYSLNGDINVWFQKGLAANMSFESFNGDFYTNVNALESLPAMVKKENREDGVRYKVNNSRYKIGEGGALLDFETFNGDVYLKEQ